MEEGWTVEKRQRSGGTTAGHWDAVSHHDLLMFLTTPLQDLSVIMALACPATMLCNQNV